MLPVDVHMLYIGEPEDWAVPCMRGLTSQHVIVHVVPGVEGHIGQARQSGFAQGHQPYCAIVDPDDEVLPGAFEACIDALETHPRADVAYTFETQVTEDGLVLARQGMEWYAPFVGKPQEALRAHHLCVYRRSALPDLGFMDDYPICAEQALKQRMWGPGKFVLVPQQGYVWRRKQNASPVRIKSRTPEVQRVLKEMSELYRWLK